jgi:cobalt-zinc-cadmium efflux system outer membrane protein
MRRVVIRATLAALLLPCGARAQELSLTESEALARLSSESPRVRAIRSSIEIARADVLAARRWPNPRLTVDRESVAGITEYLTMVAQPLPITGRRGLEVHAASTLVDASTNRADEAIRRARADMRLAFAQLLAAQAREREVTSARDHLRELADILGKREAAGDAAGFDRLRAEREVLELEADRAAAVADRARAQATLAGFFAASLDATQIVAVGRLGPAPAIPAIDTLIERAESTRGELLALRKDVDAAGFAARAADRRLVPEPEIVGGTKSSTIGGGDIGSVVTVQASLPLFDRGRPERALALARGSQAQARIDAFRQALRADIAALWHAIQERRQAADRYRSAAVDNAGQLERIARVSYDAGERGILELLDANRTAALARVRQVALDLAVRDAEIELEFVSNWELPS